MISVESASIMECLLEPIRLDILNRLRLFSLSKKQNDKESNSAKSKLNS